MTRICLFILGLMITVLFSFWLILYIWEHMPLSIKYLSKHSHPLLHLLLLIINYITPTGVLILNWNVRGLNNKIKCSTFVEHIKGKIKFCSKKIKMFLTVLLSLCTLHRSCKFKSWLFLGMLGQCNSCVQAHSWRGVLWDIDHIKARTLPADFSMLNRLVHLY